uniref:Ran-GTPase activating protein 1 C-terminal domain-containing protein n=1 Tax=Trichuris muris TaxID=70415 RepID=A0A5S6QJH7_TRIMR
MESGNSILTSGLEKLRIASENGETVSYDGYKRFLDSECDAQDMVEAIEQSAKCETLVLRGNSFGPAAAESLGRALSKKKHLRKAILSDIFTKRGVDQLPLALGHLLLGIISSDCRLCVLDLSDNALSAVGAQEVGKLLSSPAVIQLEELLLTNTGLGSIGGQTIATALKDLLRNVHKSNMQPRLRRFIVGRNRLENKGAAALAEVIEEFGSLEEVCMPQNGISKEGVTALARAFGKNLKLRVIDLGDNTFSLYGSMKMAKILPKLSQLEILNFDDCLLKSKGAVAICEALSKGSTCLKEVRIGGNELTGTVCLDILPFFEKKPHLSLLYVNGNRFGRKAIEEICSRAMEMGLSLGSFSEDEGSSCFESSDSEEECKSEDSYTEAESQDDFELIATDDEDTCPELSNVHVGTGSVVDEKSDADGNVAEHSNSETDTSNLVDAGEESVAVLEFLVNVRYFSSDDIVKMEENLELLESSKKFLQTLECSDLARIAYDVGSLDTTGMSEKLKDGIWQLFGACLENGFKHRKKNEGFCSWLFYVFCWSDTDEANKGQCTASSNAFRMLERAINEGHFPEEAVNVFTYCIQAMPLLKGKCYIASFLNAAERLHLSNADGTTEQLDG